MWVMHGSHFAAERSPHTSWIGGWSRLRARVGNLTRTPGEPPTLCKECHWIPNARSESGPRFKFSSERRCPLQHSIHIAALEHWGQFATIITFYLADVIIQSDVQNSAYQGHMTNNRTGHIRYNSCRISCQAMNILHYITFQAFSRCFLTERRTLHK